MLKRKIETKAKNEKRKAKEEKKKMSRSTKETTGIQHVLQLSLFI